MIDKVLSGDYLKGRSKVFLFVSTALCSFLFLLALFIEWRFGSHLSVSIVCLGVICLLLMAPIVLLRQDELAAVFCIAVCLYVDWYFNVRVVALGLIPVLILVRYLTRSSQQPWVLPRSLWLWILLLGLAIFPALRGYSLRDEVKYYLDVFLVPSLAFWLGNLVAQDMTRVRRLFTILAAFFTLMAVITVIQAATGRLLFANTQFDQYLEKVSYYTLYTGSSVHRAAAFLVNPDSGGTFFAVAIFIPLSLVFVSSTLRVKALYLVQVFLIVLALLATYSTGAWLASAIALLLFLILLGNMRLRLFFVGLLMFVAAVLLIFFRPQLASQMQHVIRISTLAERFVGWQVGIRVIEAFPLTGLGLGPYAYQYRSQAFRVSDPYYRELGHPHNAFLEVATMGGLPLGIVFLALLLIAMWWAWHNWTRAEGQARMLLTGGICAVTALTINSLGANSWTLAPLAALGWLILGVISSPLLAEADEPTWRARGKTFNR